MLTLVRSQRPATLFLRALSTSQEAVGRPAQLPWYVEEPPAPPAGPSNLAAPTVVKKAVTPPPDAPALLQSLFTELQTSPFLDPRYIVLTKPVDRPLAAPAPFSAPKGRRRRGGSDHGPGVGAEPIGQIWSWLLLLQLKDGIKSGSSVEHVAKAVRKLIAKTDQDVRLPPKVKIGTRDSQDGWGMLDLGDKAIHVLSKSAREKWFSDYYRHLKDDETS